MTKRSIAAKIVAGGALLLAAGGCGPDFDPPAELKTLRVLGVRMDKPAPKPGETVQLEMLYFDGAQGGRKPAAERRAIKVAWFGGCNNPPGDLFHGCFEQLLGSVSTVLGGSAGGSGGNMSGGQARELPIDLPCDVSVAGTYACANAPTAEGSYPTFSVTIPDDIITSRPPPDSKSPPYGLSFVYSAICAGDLKIIDPATSNINLPLGCFDSNTGEQLGPEDFIIAYTPIYSYNGLPNANPIVSGITVDGSTYGQACSGSDTCGEGARCGTHGTCIPVVAHCTTKKLADCPEHKFKPVVDQASAEIDPLGKDSSGNTFQEFVWVAYYTTDGTIKDELKLINDAQKGWNPEFETTWIPPSDAAGEVRLWGVLHDNRGGANWIWQDVFVE